MRVSEGILLLANTAGVISVMYETPSLRTIICPAGEEDGRSPVQISAEAVWEARLLFRRANSPL